jgi:transcription initiation factor IIE alpha subunit
VKRPCETPPRVCPRCQGSVDWERAWGNLWRCLQCGEIITVRESISSRRAVEDAIDASKRDGRW